ncbi:MAG: SGNH/GDSL hydrolase family protein [Alphaproteobacteria bacterium]
MEGTGHDRPAGGFARKALLGLASVLVSLLVAEGVARLVVPPSNPSAVESVFEATDAPGVNYVLIPGFEGTAFNADLKTNSLGFRGPEWSREKAPGTFRIAFLGDSHAFGFGVSFDRTMGELLSRSLARTLDRPVEVLNFAVSGYNSFQEAGVLEHFALRFHPDLVVIVPSSNDADKAAFADPEHFLVSKPVAPGDRSPEQSEKLAAWRRKTYADVEVSRLWTAAERAWKRWSTMPTEESRRGKQRWMGAVKDGPVEPTFVEPVMEPLRRMIRMARAAGSRVLLATFAGSQKWRLLMRTLSEQEKVPMVELLSVFPETFDWDDLVRQFSLGWNPHLGPEAHRRWAKLIEEKIVADGLASPEPAPVHSGDPGASNAAAATR